MSLRRSRQRAFFLGKHTLNLCVAVGDRGLQGSDARHMLGSGGGVGCVASSRSFLGLAEAPLEVGPDRGVLLLALREQRLLRVDLGFCVNLKLGELRLQRADLFSGTCNMSSRLLVVLIPRTV
jgi:hypothetical protein